MAGKLSGFDNLLGSNLRSAKCHGQEHCHAVRLVASMCASTLMPGWTAISAECLAGMSAGRRDNPTSQKASLLSAWAKPCHYAEFCIGAVYFLQDLTTFGLVYCSQPTTAEAEAGTRGASASQVIDAAGTCTIHH